MPGKKKGGKKKGRKKKKAAKTDEHADVVHQLIIAASTGNNEELLNIMETYGQGKVKNYDWKGKAGDAFAGAIQYGQLETATTILDKGGFVDVKNGKPLQMACRTRQLDMVQFLVRRRANVNIPSEFTGTTALMYAAQAGDLDICKFLLSRRALPDINCHSRNCGYHNGWTALHYACDRGHIPLIKTLIQSGAKIDHPTSDGDTALSIAAESGRFGVVKWMIQNGANVNSKRRQMNPTQWAVYRADPVAVEFLVSFGGQPKLQNKILWLSEQETLAQHISRDFDPEIQKRIDLAIYRGTGLLKTRASLISLLQGTRWLTTPTVDIRSFDPSAGPVMTTFPGNVAQLISAYDLQCYGPLYDDEGKEADDSQFDAPLPDVAGIPKRPKFPDRHARGVLANNIL